MTPNDTAAHDDRHDEEASSTDEVPTILQRVHWATGDRDAEAKELAKAAPDEVSQEDAKVAVKRAHGDVPSDRALDESEVATVEEAESVHEEKSHE
jgi:hypothetical protein